uniref:Glutaminase n=1 Tax=Rhabditophanes sp. KR3021 TaxID=114890 RepID=A0AC35U4D9_9BILA
MKSVLSSATVNHLSKILDIKSSANNLNTMLNETAIRLSDAFSREDKSEEDLIYELFKLPNKNEASIGKLISVLKSYGLREDDPRLLPMMDMIWKIEFEKEEKCMEMKDPKTWKLSEADFRLSIGGSIEIISQTLQNNLIIPSWTQFCSRIKEIFDSCKDIHEGKVADYIPQMAKADPNAWGISICTVDGQRMSLGNSKTPFCIQSVSKAFNYAIASSDLGADLVHQYVGQEPSGRLFNDICLDSKNLPHNPCVNAGAIIVTSLIKNTQTMADRYDYVSSIITRVK